MPDVPGRRAKVTLGEVNADDLRDVLRLRVAPEQEEFVASNAASAAQAHFEPSAWFRSICADGVPVGFVMLHAEGLKPEPEEPAYFLLWRLMIDVRFQGRGFGRRALELVVSHIREKDPTAVRLLATYVPGERWPERFYEKLGFVKTGESTTARQRSN